MFNRPFHLNYRSADLGAFAIDFHSHPLYEVYLFHSGKCSYLIGDKIFLLAPGDLILMHGMTLHRPHVDASEPYVRSVLHFDPAYVQKHMESPPFALDILAPFRQLRNTRIPLDPGRFRETDELLNKLDMLEQKQDAVSSDRALLVFLELLTLIYGFAENKLNAQIRESGSEKIRHAQKIVSYIEDHFCEDIHLPQLEETLHLDKHYLSKIFKETTGSTIFTYLYQRRINQSKILMQAQRDVKITDICYQVGFKHPAHFSRVFKHYTGLTPEQFRRTV